MAGRDLYNNIDERNALNSQTISTDTTTAGVIIDTQGYESVTFILKTGAVTAGDVTPLLQDGDDSGLSDAANVASDFLLGSYVTVDAANTLTRVGYNGKKRYVRLSAVSDNSANLVASGIVVLGHPLHAAVAQ